MATLIEGVKGFQDLSNKLGVPKCILNALAPNMQDYIAKFDGIFADYMKVFMKEMGQDEEDI